MGRRAGGGRAFPLRAREPRPPASGHDRRAAGPRARGGCAGVGRPTSRRMNRRQRYVIAAAFATLLAASGAALLFTTYMIYDDEGYVLFSLHEFVNGGGLYE